MGKNGIKTDKEGIWDEKIKKIRVGWRGKNKKFAWGSPNLCRVGKRGGVYVSRCPFVNVTNVTQRNETIYYILH